MPTPLPVLGSLDTAAACTGDLAEPFGLAQPTVSHHLTRPAVLTPVLTPERA